MEWMKKTCAGDGQDGNEELSIFERDCYAAIDGVELTCIRGGVWCVLRLGGTSETARGRSAGC